MSDLKWFGDDILAQMRDAMPDAFFEAGEKFIEVAAAKAPRQSGDLADSGYVVSEKKSTYKAGKKNRKQVKVKKGEVAAGFASFYAKFREYGTVNQSAKPFFRPALDELKNQLGNDIAAHIKARIK